VSKRASAILIGLLVQVVVTAIFVPWDPSSREFASGVKLALALGLLANVLTRLVLFRWAGRRERG
jgi:hypothetical protein